MKPIKRMKLKIKENPHDNKDSDIKDKKDNEENYIDISKPNDLIYLKDDNYLVNLKDKDLPIFYYINDIQENFDDEEFLENVKDFDNFWDIDIKKVKFL